MSRIKNALPNIFFTLTTSSTVSNAAHTIIQLEIRRPSKVDTARV